MAAEIEIHYPDGLVGYKTLSRDRPLVVGSSERCDVALDARGVASKHFAFRWSNSRQAWRFDLAGDAGGVRCNGQESAGDVLKPDDEVTLADCAFIFRDSAAAGAAAPGAAAPGGLGHPARLSAVAEQRFDESEYFQPLWKKKAVVIGVGALALLSAITAVSYVLYNRNRATSMFNAARESFDNRISGAARDQFDKFRGDYPADLRGPQARILAGVADAQNLLDNGQQLAQGLRKLDDVAKENDKLPDFNFPEVRDPFAKTLLEIAKLGGERARDARRKIDEAAYGVADAALKKVDEIGSDNPELKAEQAKMQKLLADAALQIAMEKDRQKAAADMGKALAAKRPVDVYEIHRSLYSRYQIHRDDAELKGQREKARVMEQEQTVFVPAVGAAAPAPAAAAPVASRPPVNLKPGDGAAPSNAIVAVAAGDKVFGFDSGSGELKWDIPVGMNPAFPPLPLADGGGLAIHLPRDNSLALHDLATGKEKWAAPIVGGVLRPATRPVVFQGRMYAVGLDPAKPGEGRMFAFNLETGKALGYYKFPQPLAGVPVLDEKRRRLMVPGAQVSVFTLNPGSNKCELVQALDHEPGSLIWLPSLAGQFLFTVIKQGLDKATLNCFVLSGEEGKLLGKKIDEFKNLPGLVTKEPALRGQRLFLTTDQDAFQVFDLNGEVDDKPLSLAARSLPVGDDARASAKDSPYAVAPDQRMLWTVGKTIRQYELRNGVLEPKVDFQAPLPGAPTMAPMIDQGNLIVAASDGEAGGVAVIAFSIADRKERWRSTVAAPPKAVQRDPRNPTALLLAFAGSAALSLPIADLDKAAPLTLPPPAEGAEFAADRDVTFREVPGWTDGVVQWSGVGGSLLRAYPPGQPEKLIKLPSKLAAPPGRFGKGLMIPSMSGLVYWIDPLTGADLGEPFGVAFEEGSPVPYGPALGISDTTVALAAGTSLLRLQLVEKPFPHFLEIGRIDLPDALSMVRNDPVEIRERLAATQMARAGDKLLLATGPRLHRISSGDFVVEESWKLAGQCFAAPAALGGLAVFFTDRRELVALGAADGKPASIAWRTKLEQRPLSGLQPDGADGFWLAYANGTLVRHGAADGKPQKTLDAHRGLAGGPWLLADRLVVLTPDGGLAALAK